MLHATDNRVRSHTAPEINRRIDGQIEASIRYHALHPEQIDQRLFELDREWDIERALEANAATLSVFGVLMGLMGKRVFFLLPGIVGGFLLQHAIGGWCPPVPLLRRLGFRTSAEIHRERYALKALRGDFAAIARGGNGEEAAEAAHHAVQATRH
jgi:hypothetical protein